MLRGGMVSGGALAGAGLGDATAVGMNVTNPWIRLLAAAGGAGLGAYGGNKLTDAVIGERAPWG